MQSLPVAPPTLARSLSAPFTRCPVCRGTTTMDHFLIDGLRCLGSICRSCDSRWDLHGDPVYKGQLLILPRVDPVHLPCGDFEGCASRRLRPGRPPGSFDTKPRINTGRPRGTYNRRGAPSGAPASLPVIASGAKQSNCKKE